MPTTSGLAFPLSIRIALSPESDLSRPSFRKDGVKSDTKSSLYVVLCTLTDDFFPFHLGNSQ